MALEEAHFEKSEEVEFEMDFFHADGISFLCVSFRSTDAGFAARRISQMTPNKSMIPTQSRFQTPYLDVPRVRER